MRRAALLLTLLLAGLTSFTQVNVKDSTIFTPLIYATYSFQWPGGDLGERFGGSSSIGGGFMIKTRSNWILDVEGNFMFGQSVHGTDTMLKVISTPEGQIIDANGMWADIVFYERGYNILGRFGKVIPVLSPNPNSGIMLMAGGGYMQTKIRVHNPGNTAPQLLGDYKKGYDALNAGFVACASVGYLYLGNTRLLNFYVGFEFMQAWTKGKRERNFDTGMPDLGSYNSQFYGIRVNWCIPLYSRVPKEFYLY
jgi:hypothetical protein